MTIWTKLFFQIRATVENKRIHSCACDFNISYLTGQNCGLELSWETYGLWVTMDMHFWPKMCVFTVLKFHMHRTPHDVLFFIEKWKMVQNWPFWYKIPKNGSFQIFIWETKKWRFCFFCGNLKNGPFWPKLTQIWPEEWIGNIFPLFYDFFSKSKKKLFRVT